MTTLFQILEEEWTCPINHTEIIDPVLTVDGHTYERKAIEDWFLKSDVSPKTGLALSSKNLTPNIVLKAIIDKILKHLP